MAAAVAAAMAISRGRRGVISGSSFLVVPDLLDGLLTQLRCSVKGHGEGWLGKRRDADSES
jgi:hypothetical protein